MEKQIFSFQTAKQQIDLVGYLASLGHFPTKVTGADYWYLSPLPDHTEKTASFKIDRAKQLWYDHGTGIGGDLVDFGLHYHQCSFIELRKRFMDYLPFHPHIAAIPVACNGNNAQTTSEQEKKIKVIAERDISSPSLVDYIEGRCIPLDLAKRYCHEIDFTLNGKTHTAIGFKNDLGGYEIRSARFKGSSSPKWPATILAADMEPSLGIPLYMQDIAVFEGFFDFLSFLVLKKEGHPGLPNPHKALVLDGLAFIGKSRTFLDKHANKYLFLDNGEAGDKAISNALEWGPSYTDCRSVLGGQEDVNAFLRKIKSIDPSRKQPSISNLHR